MTIYSVINIKGGVGKSTTTVQLAVWLFNNGFTVALIDNDKQQSSFDWLSEHSASITIVQTDNHTAMEKAMYQLRETHDFVLVDNSAGDTLSMNIAMQASDHILIPLPPSVVDINSTLDTIEELKMVRLRSGKPIPATIFLNQITKGTKIIQKVIDNLADVDDAKLSDIQIPYTVRIRDLSGESATVFDDKKNADLAKLYDALFDSTLN